MMLMKNQQQQPVSSNNTINNTTNGGGSTNPTGSNAQYKTYSNSVVSFQYPSSWNVLSNNANTMVIVGVSSYPDFSVYNESKYGYTSLSNYVSVLKVIRPALDIQFVLNRVQVSMDFPLMK